MLLPEVHLPLETHPPELIEMNEQRWRGVHRSIWNLREKNRP
jgi:hypothetical protein